MGQSPAQRCVCHVDQNIEAPTPGSMPAGGRSRYFLLKIEPLRVGQSESSRFRTVHQGYLEGVQSPSSALLRYAPVP